MRIFAIAQIAFLGVFIYSIITAIKGKSKNRVNQDNVPEVPNKYRTINSHYSQSTLKGVSGNVQNSGPAINNAHNHAYEHKVQPIEEVTVMDKFEDRKEAYRERKKQMKADLPKSSYTQTQEKIKQATSPMYRDVHREYGKNGDNGAMVSPNEISIKCAYCGAFNIIPRSKSKKYSCYFCRQEV